MKKKKLSVYSQKWTTLDGRKIAYKDLSDDHLKNIIKDGYRNPKIEREALIRGIEVPKRPVDQLTHADLAMWIESFASVSLSGNEFATAMMDLWNDGNPDPSFYLNLNRFLEAIKYGEKKRKENKNKI